MKNADRVVVLFWDMHSGGGAKEAWTQIYIECADEAEACRIFYNRFGHNPARVTCTCCGEDYSVHAPKELGQESAFHRSCQYDKQKDCYVEEPDERRSKYQPFLTVAAYLKQESVLLIRAKEIKPHERKGEVPEQGYVWQD